MPGRCSTEAQVAAAAAVVELEAEQPVVEQVPLQVAVAAVEEQLVVEQAVVVAAVEEEEVAALPLRVLLRQLLPRPWHLLPLPRMTAPPRASHRSFAEAVKCRARTPSRTKPLYTVPLNTASTRSSNS